MKNRLSEEFRTLSLICKEKDVCIKELALKLQTKDQAILTLILSLPYLFFIPLPGLSILFGFFIMINGLRITTARKLWFPSFVLCKKISAYSLKKWLSIAEKWALRVEKMVKPRGDVFFKKAWFAKLHGIMLMVCGFFLCLPQPPGVNFLPGLTTFILSLGIIEQDGYCILLSYIFFVLVLSFYIALPIVGIEKISSFVS